MNELERLIAGLPRPEPGEALDGRIGALLALHATGVSTRRWKETVAWVAMAACVGAIAFYLGRQSALPAPPQPMAVAQASNPTAELAPPTSRVTSIPLAEDQLADLFVHTTPREGMFGNGPMKVEIVTSH